MTPKHNIMRVVPLGPPFFDGRLKLIARVPRGFGGFGAPAANAMGTVRVRPTVAAVGDVSITARAQK